ncbi:hypothetical protein F4559_000028 [Saccharothrix violaceirubra]|uniref:Uncharacterized protein n=1 Tax=Saccharothrix violaceirubra TaxID=413306 RepID=A0A7W7SXF1_9PSEU|nr:hypothetical protein [Saccharothrix violaceirubra]
MTTSRTQWLHQRRVTCVGDTTDDSRS